VNNLPPLYGVGGTAVGGYEVLKNPDPPYLPEMEGGTGYCLVLDLDETLVHYLELNGEGTFFVRPGCDKFLTEMAELYEVVIFTAAMEDYANWVLNTIDKKKRIKYRLYR
jgi:CTD small phosphatase-like protein 2